MLFLQVTSGGFRNGNSKIDLAISKTCEFFEALGVKIRLSEYGVTVDRINDVIDALGKHGRTALLETGDLTLDISRKILENAM